MGTPILFGIFMIRYVIVPYKSRLVKNIEKIGEIQDGQILKYENFDDIINCTAR